MRRLFFLLLVSLAIMGFYLGFGVLSGPDTVTVYFYRYEKLQPVRRTRQNDLPKATVALTELLAGPTTEERSNRIQTMLPPQLQCKSWSKANDILILDFNQELLKISGGHNVIEGALKQIVFTATEIKGIKAVRFQVENQRGGTLVIGGEGYTIERPLGRDYFAGEY
ncbi:hypothetical protein NO2_0558 [Candidatus Termititenax persephonae]|uniref:GerMN domain-containing protein n=1 Tax=Candidatus Termititenax persephonae TaxID=2218525 RepID=A0A388TFS7_9BACT|nr:hypothetical protein NO2_0558 [Candidatus Termititenax persephonae]